MSRVLGGNDCRVCGLRHVQPLTHPSDPVITYDIELHVSGMPAHKLGIAHDLERARRAAVSQASRLKKDGSAGEVVVIELPAGTVVAREIIN